MPSVRPSVVWVVVVVMSATHAGSTRDESSCLIDFICSSSSAVSVCLLRASSDSCQESAQTLLSSAAAVCLSQRLWDLTRKGRTESAFWNRFQLHELDTIYLEPSRRDPFRHGRRCNKVFVLIYNQIRMSLDNRGGAAAPRRY